MSKEQQKNHNIKIPQFIENKFSAYGLAVSFHDPINQQSTKLEQICTKECIKRPLF